MARDLITGLLNINIGQASEKKIGIVYLDIDKVVPSDDNFYHINDDDIQMMAYAIEAVGQIEQPLLVKKISDSDKYELIAGHKRRAGANYLVEQGKKEFRTLPCIIKDESIENELSLILTNATQRELTSFEKMKQVEILRNYIEKYEIKGNKREIISSIINLSKSEIGRLENINKNLAEPLKEHFESGVIATGTANEIASMPPDKQQEVGKIIKEHGTIKMGEVKAIKEKLLEEEQQIEGQMETHDYPECIPDEEIVAESTKTEKQEESFVSDAEFRRMLEEVWKEAHKNYNLAKKPNAVPKEVLIQLQILKEAMDMYRNNYIAEEEGKRDGF